MFVVGLITITSCYLFVSVYPAGYAGWVPIVWFVVSVYFANHFTGKYLNKQLAKMGAEEAAEKANDNTDA